MRQLLCVAILLIVSAVPALSQATTIKTNVQIPLNLAFVVPCAAGGAGETVGVTGTLHFLFLVTIDSNGGVQMQEQSQPMGVVGIGLTTGERYRGTGVTRSAFAAASGGPITFTSINRFNLIGPRPGNNFTVRQTVHRTINADGTVTVYIENTAVECK